MSWRSDRKLKRIGEESEEKAGRICTQDLPPSAFGRIPGEQSRWRREIRDCITLFVRVRIR